MRSFREIKPKVLDREMSHRRCRCDEEAKRFRHNVRVYEKLRCYMGEATIGSVAVYAVLSDVLIST